MADEDDASTDVDSLAEQLAAKMTSVAAKIQEARRKKAAAGEQSPKKGKGDKPAVIPDVDFEVRGGICAFRTPAQQASTVADGHSWVCWSAHMADKARDLRMNSKPVVKTWEAAFGREAETFKKAWIAARNSLGLKDANGKDGWKDNDPFHVELEDSKIDRNGKQAQACVEEYVKLTRKRGKNKNASFEKNYPKMIEKAEKKLKLGGDVNS